MRISRRLLPDWLSLVVVALALASRAGWAGELAPELRSALDGAAPDEAIAVLVDLEPRETPVRLGLGRRADRLARLVTLLKSQASEVEAPVRRFLDQRGAPRVVSLWAIGGLAATVPASAVRDLAAQPGVRGVRLDRTYQLNFGGNTADRAMAESLSNVLINPPLDGSPGAGTAAGFNSV